MQVAVKKLNPLVEVFTFDEAQLTIEEREDSSGKKQLWLETIVQRADTRNRNGRVYPRSVLEREVRRFQKHIEEGTSYGEADHPKPGQTPSVTRQAILWKKVWIDEQGVVRGRGVIMKTRAGHDVRAILEVGGAIGTSSRGRGTVSLKNVGTESKQVEVVNDDFRLRTFDLVIDQSVEDAVSRMVKYEQHLIEQEMQDNDPEETTVMKLTLESLKSEHPEAYKALMAEAKEEAKGEVQENLQNMLAEREAEIREEIRNELIESGDLIDEEEKERVTALEAFCHVMIEAAKEAGLIGIEELAEDEVAEEMASLKREAKQAKTRIAALEAALAKAQATEEKTAVEEAAAEFSKDHALSDELCEALISECADMETFEAKREAIKGRYDRIAERLDETPPSGNGRTHLDEGGNPKPSRSSDDSPDGDDMTETQKRLRQMGGLLG